MLFLLPSTRTKTPTSTEEKRDLKTLRLLLWITLERKTFEKDEHKVKSVWGFYNQFFYSFWIFFVDRWKRYENSDVEEYRFPLIGRRILSRICVGGAKTCFISHARMKRSKSRAGHFFFSKQEVDLKFSVLPKLISFSQKKSACRSYHVHDAFFTACLCWLLLRTSLVLYV